MTDSNVRLVVAKDVLFRLPEHQDKYIAFLRHWLLVNDTKAVATLSAWKEFIKFWEDRLKGSSQEITAPFFASIRGLVTPYRIKYLDEANVGVDTDKESMDVDELTIVEWHYATVKYFIADETDKFSSKIAKSVTVSDDIVLTPRGLYSKYEVEDGKIIDQFNDEFEN